LNFADHSFNGTKLDEVQHSLPPTRIACEYYVPRSLYYPPLTKRDMYPKLELNKAPPRVRPRRACLARTLKRPAIRQRTYRCSEESDRTCRSEDMALQDCEAVRSTTSTHGFSRGSSASSSFQIKNFRHMRTKCVVWTVGVSKSLFSTSMLWWGRERDLRMRGAWGLPPGPFLVS
jgi:hypothetical protein